MSDLSKRISVSILAAICAAPVAFIFQRAIAVSHLLDPYADQLGGWLQVHLTPDQAVWTAAAFITAVLYLIALGFIWSHFHSHPGEGANNKDRRRRQAPRSRDASIDQRGPLRINVGADGPFFDVSNSDLYSFTRRLRIQACNDDKSKAALNCKIQITDISPYTGYRGPWLLRENFTLAAGDSTFVPLVSYREARNPLRTDASDTSIEVCSIGNHPPLLPTEESAITVRMTATDMPFCEIQCVVWKNLLGKLQIRTNKERTEEEKKREVRDVLSAFVNEGKWLLNKCRDEKEPVPNLETWENKVRSYLAVHHEPSYLARYSNLTPFEKLTKAQSGLTSTPHHNAWLGMRGRLVRLDQFISEFK
jgi:hypothetical protein